MISSDDRQTITCSTSSLVASLLFCFLPDLIDFSLLPVKRSVTNQSSLADGHRPSCVLTSASSHPGKVTCYYRLGIRTGLHDVRWRLLTAVRGLNARYRNMSVNQSDYRRYYTEPLNHQGICLNMSINIPPHPLSPHESQHLRNEDRPAFLGVAIPR